MITMLLPLHSSSQLIPFLFMFSSACFPTSSSLPLDFLPSHYYYCCSSYFFPLLPSVLPNFSLTSFEASFTGAYTCSSILSFQLLGTMQLLCCLPLLLLQPDS